MGDRPRFDIIDITEAGSFGLLPPCADTHFDHRSCDYWEDEVRGLKTARPAWWQAPFGPKTAGPRAAIPDNPFVPPPAVEPAFNPFALPGSAPASDPWSSSPPGASDELVGSTDYNPFAPPPKPRAGVGADAPRKLRLLTRGLTVFGSYAKVLTLDGVPAVYAQFGPLSAYPRAQQIRDLYPRLPSAPLPAVVTCVASTPAARGFGLARELVAAVTLDLARRGFAAAEAYPDLTLAADQASAAHPDFWVRCGFVMAVDDPRYPVMRIELG